MGRADDHARMVARLTDRGLLCPITGRLTDAGHAYNEQLLRVTLPAQQKARLARPPIIWRMRRKVGAE